MKSRRREEESDVLPNLVAGGSDVLQDVEWGDMAAIAEWAAAC